MLKKAMAKKDETPTTPDSFLVKEVRIINKLSRESVEHLQNDYVEPGSGIVLHFCGKEARVNRSIGEGDTSFVVYYDQFRLGLHFPLCPEFAAVLKHYGIILAQLVPNSVASIMSFIIYLRRIKQAFTLESFQQHFRCRFLQGGYAQFSATSVLTVLGLENKVEKWKSNFCRVTSPVDLDIPRVPSSIAIEPISKAPAKGAPVLVLDTRQYAKNIKVVKRMIYPDEYTELTAEDWEELDKEIANLPKPKSPKKAEGKKKRKAKSPIEWEEEVAETDIPSTSRAHEESGEQTMLLEDAPARIPAPQKRKRMVQGPLRGFGARAGTASTSTAIPDIPGVSEQDLRVVSQKVAVDMEKGKAIVDLNMEWFPSTSCPEGVAQSLGLSLYSANLKGKMEDTPVVSLLDQYARHQAAAWNMGSYFGTELDRERKKNIFLNTRIKNLERSHQMLTDSAKEKHKKTEEAEKAHKRQIEDMTKAFKEAFEKREKEYLETINKMKASSALDIRNGIALCLEQLSKAKAVVPEWNDTDKILGLVVANVEVPKEGEDSDRTDSDEESTTVG